LPEHSFSFFSLSAPGQKLLATFFEFPLWDGNISRDFLGFRFGAKTPCKIFWTFASERKRPAAFFGLSLRSENSPQDFLSFRFGANSKKAKRFENRPGSKFETEQFMKLRSYFTFHLKKMYYIAD